MAFWMVNRSSNPDTSSSFRGVSAAVRAHCAGCLGIKFLVAFGVLAMATGLPVRASANSLDGDEQLKPRSPIFLPVGLRAPGTDFAGNGVAPRYEADELLKRVPTMRGWDFLASRLRHAGIPESRIQRLFADGRMPRFAPINFGLNPKEGHHMYTGFTSANRLKLAREFMSAHRATLNQVEKRYGVDSEVVTAILLVETHFGKVTGKERVVNRLARLAGLSDPDNVRRNWLRLKKESPRQNIKLEDVQARSRYLQGRFFPEMPAIMMIAEKQKVDVFEIRGSSAGAFGIPQFLPTNFVKYGVDADKDGRVSLFDIEDAIMSTGNFLSGKGWKPKISRPAQEKVVWAYNPSQAYVDTVLRVASSLRSSRR